MEFYHKTLASFCDKMYICDRINDSRTKSTIMQITDLDFNHSKEFTVEVDDYKTADVMIDDFLDFMSNWKGWLFDADSQIITIPEGRYHYLPEADDIKELGLIVRGSLAAKSYTWDSFRKRYAVEISDFIFEYISDADIVWEEEEYDPTVETAQEEAWRDFRAAQMI